MFGGKWGGGFEIIEKLRFIPGRLLFHLGVNVVLKFFIFFPGFEWNGFLIIVLPRCCNCNLVIGTLRAPHATMKAPFGWHLGEGPERRDNARSPICRSVEVNVRSELIRVERRFVDRLLCTMVMRVLWQCVVFYVLRIYCNKCVQEQKRKWPSKFAGQ
ncbi:hypothetical protein CDAR_425321 [Caerostris darwini]|uniref:Transmembrane protein n=1 Tax=Caerostris darwini TaxID=1538125 RepID=A0AAV4UN12_9ARAC|nr:hypothetical protein CDAR_425321 [Caerostris darwini]